MQNFEQYDNDHPQIWQAFVHFSVKTKAKGFKKYGAFGIINLIRWHTGIDGGEDFKVNNNYAPDYARKMEAKHPEFKGFFRLRVLKVARIGTKKGEEWTV